MANRGITAGGDREVTLRTLEFMLDAVPVLQEVLRVFEAGGDFQLGPAGRHRDLPSTIRSLIQLAKATE